jgi:NADPH-dependent ferric siderophore reductase
MAVEDPLLAMVGRPGGPLAEAAVWPITVRQVEAITDDYRRITFSGPSLGQLSYQPGQDLMMRIPSEDERPINRRYTIRRADPTQGTVVVDMVLHGDGPGARWAAQAAPGDSLDAIGPRGKIVVDQEANWHLFVGDETALPGMAAMVESLPGGATGIAIVELPRHVSGHDPTVSADQDVQIKWIERGDTEPGEAARLVAAVQHVELAPGPGHAYIAGEMKVVRALTAALTARGFDAGRVSPKAYWRRGGANAPHGEPLDPDQPERSRR